MPIAIFDVVLKGGQVTGNEEDGCTVQAERHADAPLFPTVSVDTVHHYGNIRGIGKTEQLRVEPSAPCSQLRLRRRTRAYPGELEKRG